MVAYHYNTSNTGETIMVSSVAPRLHPHVVYVQTIGNKSEGLEPTPGSGKGIPMLL